jgi:8-amino-3,8-dideoxy-alpha-D-manno-octulosonate transaminase
MIEAALHRLKRVELFGRRWFLPDMFNRLEVETQSACNRRCGYCPVAAAPRPPHRMPAELFHDILDQAAAMGFHGRFSPHFYGEPLLDERLPALLAEVRRRLPGALVVIYTNGDLLDPDTAQRLLAAGVKRFVVTFEAGESEAFRRTRRSLPAHRFRLRFHVQRSPRDFPEAYNRAGTVRIEATPRTACYASASTLVVDAWGRVRLCFNDYAGSLVWGDLATDRLAEVWRRPAYARTRRELLQGVFRHRACQRCTGRAPLPLPEEPP